MNAIQTESSDFRAQMAAPAPLLRTLVVCDLVESTALVQRLGDQAAATLMHQLDRQTRDLLYRHNGREIDKTDGFLLMFERPIQAVAFALDYQRLLRDQGQTEALPLAARIGIHVGDVVLWENTPADVARGAKPVELEGLVKPIAARLMNLALPGQILLSPIANTLAQRAQIELLAEHTPPLWREHGRYQFKGVAETMRVYEVGEIGVAPLKRPAWNGKAYREVPWWRRPGVLVLEVALLCAAIAVPAYLWLRSPPAIAFARRDWVVIGSLTNQTNEGVLDDSLSTAFRISLEQSRYVNLVSELQVRDTLARMQRPADAKVDRIVGSEIALRDGARALILPSVAEIGGRVRVSAEVVDPHTQATVYSESADGVGMESILPSVGTVADRLRVRLGEALASVDAANVPLPKATTANLDALRAYALGLQAHLQNHESDALAMFRHAVELDPGFAMAYMGMARIYADNSDDADARANVLKAAALKGRLTARDQLYVEAHLADFGPPGPMLEKWQLLGKLYPDYYAAADNYATFAYQYENRYAEAIKAIQPALSEYDPFRGQAYYTLATLQTAENHFDAAQESFRTAAANGDVELGIAHAGSFAAQRRFAEATRLLDRAKPSGLVSDAFFLTQLTIAMQLDQGDWNAARTLATHAVKAAAKAGPHFERVARANELTLDDYLAPKTTQHDAVLRDFIADARKAMEQAAITNHDDDVFAVLYGAYLAARAGDEALATATLAAATPQAHGSGYPNLEHLLAITQAELDVRGGRANDAIARLQPGVDGTELYLTHVALADAYTAAGRNDDALKQAQWLAAHRGQAYMEWNSFQLLQSRNVAESDLALLRTAELEHALGHGDDAKKALAAFMAIWPEAKQPAFVAARIKKLE